MSKLECQAATPTISSLERLAKALEVTVRELLVGEERNRQAEVRELMKDKFLASLLPFVPRLSPVQMTAILAQSADLIAQATRCRVVR